MTGNSTAAAQASRPSRGADRGPVPLRTIVTIEDAEMQARELAGLVARSASDCDLVIGIANGGIHPAFYVAQNLGVPLGICRVQRRTSLFKQKLGFARKLLSARLLRKPVYVLNRLLDRWLGGVSSGRTKLDVPVRDKAVLIVDDCIDSGASVAHIRNLMHRQGAAETRIAVLCWTTKYDSAALHGVTPDFTLGRVLPSYPWSADSPDYSKFQQWLADHQQAGGGSSG